MKRLHNYSFLFAAVTTVSFSLNTPSAQAATLTTTQNNNPTALISALLGDTTGLDLSSFNVQTIGNAQAFGTFQQDPFGLASGVVVSTGKVTDIPGVNKCSGGVGLTRTVASVPIGSDTGIFNCTNIGRADGGIPVTTPPGGGGSAVPEPLTIVGTLIGGTVAFRMRKKLRSTNKT